MEKEVYVASLNLCEFGKITGLKMVQLEKFLKEQAGVSVIVDDGTLVLEDMVPMGKAKAVSGMVQAWCALKGVEVDMYYKPSEDE